MGPLNVEWKVRSIRYKDIGCTSMSKESCMLILKLVEWTTIGTSPNTKNNHE